MKFILPRKKKKKKKRERKLLLRKDQILEIKKKNAGFLSLLYSLQQSKLPHLAIASLSYKHYDSRINKLGYGYAHLFESSQPHVYAVMRLSQSLALMNW